MTRISKPNWLHRALLRLPRHTAVVPAAIGAVMVFLVVAAWALIPNSGTRGFDADAHSNLESFAARLESHISTRLAIGHQLRLALIGGQIKDREGFLAQTSYIHKLFSDFQAINWVDSKGVIRWLSPLKGNERAENLDVRQLAVPGAALAAAERTGQMQITPPIRLAQGGDGFVAYVPVMKLKRLTGFVNIVFRIKPLINATMREGFLKQYDVFITDGPLKVYGSTGTTEGRIEAFRKTITVGNRNWTVALLPTPATIAAHKSAIDELILVTLVILSIAIAWLIRLAMVHQQKLQASDKLFRTFIEYSPSAIFIKDAQGRYLHANSKWHEWYNPERINIVGKKIDEFFLPDQAQTITAQEKEVFRRGLPISGETNGMRPNGTIVPSMVQKFPIMDDNGTVIAMGGINTDITEQKRAEETLRLALMKAEEANQSKSKFLATMSHELRTPLNAIIGFSDILMGQYFGPVGNQKYTEYAKDINHSGRHLLSLIDEVLDISAIELGKRDLVLEPLVLEALLTDCVRAVTHRAEGKGIQLSLETDKALPVIKADETAMRQIFLNLLTNAIKFSHAGDRITVTARANDEKITVAVADTGDGIREDQLNSVTEPFVKGHSNSHITHEGVGLGLSIVKSFVTAHKGTLLIESELGRGTTVIITFPQGRDRMVA
ncbi:MAG: PAS domain-containing protein [Sneathiella sp.]|nr:PAS domain-containing protein [Sneathiella sp.]